MAVEINAIEPAIKASDRHDQGSWARLWLLVTTVQLLCF